MESKRKQICPRSLENLKLGASARNQDKVRHNFTLLPSTMAWLKATGNASEAIDNLVAVAKATPMGRNSNFSSVLPPTKIHSSQLSALKELADRMQVSQSTLIRMAIAEFLAKHGFNN